MNRIIPGVSLLLLAGIGWAQAAPTPARGSQIGWVKDLAAAQQRARAQKKLVLQFLMLGDLTDPHC